jgi:hypothetical protein
MPEPAAILARNFNDRADETVSLLRPWSFDYSTAIALLPPMWRYSSKK